MDSRIRILKKMHQYIINLDDEDIYSLWITLGVPDEPSEEDFKFISETDGLYFYICELFSTLIIKRTKQYEI